MEKLIILPPILKQKQAVLTDQFPIFFNLLQERLGFKISYKQDLKKMTNGTSLVLLFANAHARNILKQVENLNKRIKLILYMGGPHNYMKGRGNFKPAIDRADLIMSGSNRLFLKTFPEAKNKFMYLPNFFAPVSRYLSLNYNKSPIRKCLMTGHKGPKVYPLRTHIKSLVATNRKARDLICIMRHPRWERKDALASYEIPAAMGENYARTINSYLCAIATGSKYGYALAKYYEIPAAGALLLAVPVQDAADSGLAPGKHYVPICKDNFLEIVQDVLKRPGKYEKIRLQGMVNARKRHSVKNRVKQFEEALSAL